MRRLVMVLLVLNCLLLPLLCVPLLFLFNAVNGMQLVFITKFTVKNDTAATMYVTPVGIADEIGRQCPLPLVLWKAPWWPASQRGRFPIQSGETITLHYDRDDVELTELVVESEDGQVRQSSVFNPRVTDHVIKNAGDLQPLEPSVKVAYEAAQETKRIWPILAAFTSPALSFVLLRRWYGRLRPIPTHRPAEPGSTELNFHVTRFWF